MTKAHSSESWDTADIVDEIMRERGFLPHFLAQRSGTGGALCNQDNCTEEIEAHFPRNLLRGRSLLKEIEETNETKEADEPVEPKAAEESGKRDGFAEMDQLQPGTAQGFRVSLQIYRFRLNTTPTRTDLAKHHNDLATD